MAVHTVKTVPEDVSVIRISMVVSTTIDTRAMLRSNVDVWCCLSSPDSSDSKRSSVSELVSLIAKADNSIAAGSESSASRIGGFGFGLKNEITTMNDVR